MNRAIAILLRDQLTGLLPVCGKMSGLVQTVEYQEVVPSEDESMPPVALPIKRFPVSKDIIRAQDFDDDFNPDFFVGLAPECADRNDMIPNEGYNGILYFEDKGVRRLGKISGESGTSWQSNLRIVLWFNPNAIATPGVTDKASILLPYIESKLTELNRTNHLPFSNLMVQVGDIPPMNKSVFSEYTYDAYRVPFLLSPYEYYAIPVSVNYSIYSSCVSDLIFQNIPLCP